MILQRERLHDFDAPTSNKHFLALMFSYHIDKKKFPILITNTSEEEVEQETIVSYHLWCDVLRQSRPWDYLAILKQMFQNNKKIAFLWVTSVFENLKQYHYACSTEETSDNMKNIVYRNIICKHKIFRKHFLFTSEIYKILLDGPTQIWMEIKEKNWVHLIDGILVYQIQYKTDS